MATLLSNLIKKGELPEVKVEVHVSRESIIDLAAAAIITVILISLINKYLLSEL